MSSCPVALFPASMELPQSHNGADPTSLPRCDATVCLRVHLVSGILQVPDTSRPSTLEG